MKSWYKNVLENYEKKMFTLYHSNVRHRGVGAYDNIFKPTAVKLILDLHDRKLKRVRCSFQRYCFKTIPICIVGIIAVTISVTAKISRVRT